MGRYSPCEADDAIIDVDETEVGCWYGDVEDVDDELVARVRTHPGGSDQTKRRERRDVWILFKGELFRLTPREVAEISLGPGAGGR